MTRTGLPDDYSQAVKDANHGRSLGVYQNNGLRSTTVAQLASEFGCDQWEVLEAILKLYPDMQIRVDTSGGQRLQIRRFVEGEYQGEANQECRS